MLQWVLQYISFETFVWMILAFPLFGAVVNGLRSLVAAVRKKETSHFVTILFGCGAPVLSFVVVATVFVVLLGFTSHSMVTGPLFQWALLDDLIIDIGLKIDPLSLVMASVITGVGSLIHIYSVGYMGHDKGFTRYFSYLNLFLFFMLVLVLADSLVFLFVGWEGVGLCSYLLIGFWFEDEEKAKAGKKAFVVNRIGDAGFLLGLFLIYVTLKSANLDLGGDFFNFDTLKGYAHVLIPVATPVCLLLFFGACGKSAQIPLYVWLPDAMAGPTPVSALIHAATMVTAGVYMVARLSFLYTLTPTAMSVVAIIGAATALFAATIGLLQNDIKKILAYSTISQLGYMFLALGVGAFHAAIFHLMTHAFFKALLFLGSGSVIHAMHGEQDIRKYGGLSKRMPITTWTFVIASLAIAGIFPLAGFFSKDAILWHTYNSNIILWGVGFAGAGLTAFYMFRLIGLTFFGESNMDEATLRKVHESPPSMAVPLLLLAVLSIAGGWIGIPEAMGGSDYFHHWLGEVLAYTPVHGSHTEELVLGGVSFLWAAHFAIIAWMIYSQKRDWPTRVVEKFRRLYWLIYNKYFVDEIYDVCVIRPIRNVSERFFWKISDAILIDGLLVHGTGRAVQFFGRILSAVQSGVVQLYLTLFLLGAVLLLWKILY